MCELELYDISAENVRALWIDADYYIFSTCDDTLSKKGSDHKMQYVAGAAICIRCGYLHAALVPQHRLQ